MKKIFLLYIMIFALIIPDFYFVQAELEPIGERIVKEAALWIGTPYGTENGEGGYGSSVDCSGLVMQVFKKFGVSLPRTSNDQAAEGEKIPLNEMVAGDIVCFAYDGGDIGHVGIYIGGNAMIHSPNPKKCVEISYNFEDWGSIKAVYGRRIEVESDYSPISAEGDTFEAIKKLLSAKNTLSIQHLKDIENSGDEPSDGDNTEGNGEGADSDNEGANGNSEDADGDGEGANGDVVKKALKTIVLEIDNPIMLVDGTEKPIEAGQDTISPRIINERTHLPLRSVADELGASVEWLGGNPGEIRVYCNGVEITLWVGSSETVVNGQVKYIDSAPVIISDRTFLPIRFIANEFGWELHWNGENKKISLSATINEI